MCLVPFFFFFSKNEEEAFWELKKEGTKQTKKTKKTILRAKTHFFLTLVRVNKYTHDVNDAVRKGFQKL